MTDCGNTLDPNEAHANGLFILQQISFLLLLSSHLPIAFPAGRLSHVSVTVSVHSSGLTI
jgi:hypothetical protein